MVKGNLKFKYRASQQLNISFLFRPPRRIVQGFAPLFSLDRYQESTRHKATLKEKREETLNVLMPIGCVLL